MKALLRLLPILLTVSLTAAEAGLITLVRLRYAREAGLPSNSPTSRERTVRYRKSRAHRAWVWVEALTRPSTARCVRKALISASPIS